MNHMTIPVDEMKQLIEIVYGKQSGEIKDFEKFLNTQIKNQKSVFAFLHNFFEKFLDVLMSPEYTVSQKQQIKEILNKIK